MPSMLFRLVCNQVVPDFWASTMKKICMALLNDSLTLTSIAYGLNVLLHDQSMPAGQEGGNTCLHCT